MRINDNEDDNENEDENSLPEAIHQPSSLNPKPSTSSQLSLVNCQLEL